MSEALEDESYEIEYDSSAGTILVKMNSIVQGHSWKASVYYIDDGVNYITQSAIAMSSPDGNSIRINDTSGSLQDLDSHNYQIDLLPNEETGEKLHFEFTYSNDTGFPVIGVAIAAIVIAIVSALLILLIRKLIVVKN